MIVCADTSFIVKLLTPESGSDAAIAVYRSLNRPRLPYTQIHRMEVESAIAQKAYIASQAGRRKRGILREKEAALDRLEKWLQMALLVETEIDWPDCFEKSLESLPAHSEKLGCRTLDLIHITIASQLHADTFITCDQRQSRAAKAEGLKTELVKIR